MMIIEETTGRNMMIYRLKDGWKHVICSVLKCTAGEGIIKRFYSAKDANDNGWVYTNDINYCDPSKHAGAWVCPVCAKGKFK